MKENQWDLKQDFCVFRHVKIKTSCMFHECEQGSHLGVIPIINTSNYKLRLDRILLL